MRFSDGPVNHATQASNRIWEGRREEMVGTSPKHAPMNAKGKTGGARTLHRRRCLEAL